MYHLIWLLLMWFKFYIYYFIYRNILILLRELHVLFKKKNRKKCLYTSKICSTVHFLEKIRWPARIWSYLVRVRLDSAETFASAFFQKFFFMCFRAVTATVHVLCMNNSCKVWLVKPFLANQCTPCTVHGPTNFTFQQLFH